MIFSKREIKDNLLGGLEIFLLMHRGAKRFGNTYKEALRSFIIPILLFPFSLAALNAFPVADLAGTSKNTMTLLFSLRLAVSWLLFFGVIAWILQRVDHMENFYRFVIATNWLTIPSTLIYLPVVMLLLSGTWSWEQVYPFMTFLTFYTYAFSAFMAVNVLIIPWELAGFFAFVAIMVDKNTTEVFHFFSNLLSS